MLPFLFALSGVEVPLPLTLSLASSGRLTEWASELSQSGDCHWVVCTELGDQLAEWGAVSQATLWILSLSGVYRVGWPTHWVKSSQSGDSVNHITEQSKGKTLGVVCQQIHNFWCFAFFICQILEMESVSESYHWVVKRQNTRSGVSTDTQLLVFCLFYLPNFFFRQAIHSDVYSK